MMESTVELTTFENIIRWVFFLLGGLPLPIYPGVLLASLMGLGSHSSIKPALIYELANKCFLWGSIVYPAVYMICYRIARAGNVTKSPLVIAALPLFYLLFLYVCFRFMDAPPKYEK